MVATLLLTLVALCIPRFARTQNTAAALDFGPVNFASYDIGMPSC